MQLFLFLFFKISGEQANGKLHHTEMRPANSWTPINAPRRVALHQLANTRLQQIQLSNRKMCTNYTLPFIKKN